MTLPSPVIAPAKATGVARSIRCDEAIQPSILGITPIHGTRNTTSTSTSLRKSVLIRKS